MTSWESVKSAFNPDGALRDIYIFQSNRALWDELIRLVSKSEFRHELWHGESNIEMPGNI